MGCPLGQGYLLGRPQDPAAMLELVAAAKVATVAVAA
jgi:EAL domain-containing protein (putative c-di-GMP-specific phosphodiesterase class I)